MKQINRVLLIDDDDTTNMLNKRLVGKLGICKEIHLVSDGMQAFDYITKKAIINDAGLHDYPRPDLIFLDVRMPVLDGFGFLEKYNKLSQEYKSNAIIIMLSTSLREEDQSKAKEHKATFYLEKPLLPATLENVLKKHQIVFNQKDHA